MDEGFAGCELCECVRIEDLMLAIEKWRKPFGIVRTELKTDARPGIGHDRAVQSFVELAE